MCLNAHCPKQKDLSKIDRRWRCNASVAASSDEAEFTSASQSTLLMADRKEPFAAGGMHLQRFLVNVGGGMHRGSLDLRKTGMWFDRPRGTKANGGWYSRFRSL